MTTRRGRALEDGNVLKADIIYLMMRKKYHVSCNLRVQWYLDHLNTCITIPPSPWQGSEEEEGEDVDLRIVSVLPLEPPTEWRPETSHHYCYLITPQSSVIFLTHQYRVAFCLDLSPSVSAVDIQRGEVMSDEILIALRRSVEGMIQPFTVPGSCFLFQPDIYVTVIAHTPFYATPAQQVLVQGWRLTPNNVRDLLSCVESQLIMLEDVVAEVTSVAHEQLDALRAESERLVGDLFEEEHSESQALSAGTGHIPMVSPDAGFINMLRYGLLALRLLPNCSSSNLVVLTDGIIATPDVKVLDSVVTQLRANAVACSFVQLGSRFHPHCSAGLVPYRDLLQYLASATQGSYVTDPGEIVPEPLTMNFYHKAFLTWSFRRPCYEFSNPVPQGGEWHVSNQLFYGGREPQLLLKKQAEEKLNISLNSLLCCRLHQGYSIKGIFMKDGQVELNLVQAWNSHIFLDYKVTAPWPGGYPVHYSLFIQAPYEFLHDITCLLKKPLGSPFRQLVVSRFWHTLKILAQSDQLLVHLHSLSSTASTPPDVVRSGMPLFYLPTMSLPPTLPVPVLATNETSCQQFAQFWRPLTMLDPAMWQRWLHTHNLVLLLRHDMPLPQYLHLPNNSGRFQVVQCRHAATSLYALLKDWSSFILIENHSYVKFMQGQPKDPSSTWFFLIRATSKPPCVVVQLAFLGGTPADLRHQMVNQLSQKIEQLAFPQRTSSNLSFSCCLILHKPVDKILIRYERMPSSLDTVVFPDGTQPALGAQGSTTLSPGSLLTTLSRYLHHRRWVWAAQSGPHFPLGQDAIARILATLTKSRLREGFCFAHSTAGIINLVLEIEMMQESCANDHNPPQYCVIQYVLFPPHVANTSFKDSGSEDEGADDGDAGEEGELQLVMECWVEPQCGTVSHSPPQRSYMDGLPYHRIADAICLVDAQCISSLLTMEHVRLMCEQGHVQPPISCDAARVLSEFPRDAAVWAEHRIRCLPFAYDLTSLLPRCQQAELLFSMFIQDLSLLGAANGSSVHDLDAPNNLLLNIMLDQLSMLHDRELPLSREDSDRFTQHLKGRSRPPTAPPLPLPPDLGEKGAKWRCFVRRMSPNRVLLTLVPATYTDLKALMIPNPRDVSPRGVKLLCTQPDSFEHECLDVRTGTPDMSPQPLQPQGSLLLGAVQVTPSARDSSGHLLSHFSRRLRSSDVDTSLGTSPLMDSPFRMRASSWDPKSGGSGLSVKRARTSSMGAKSNPSKLSLGLGQGRSSPAQTNAPTAESSPLAQWKGTLANRSAPEWERPACERSLSCETSLYRARTQSMDSKNKRYSASQMFLRKELGEGGAMQRKRSSSIDLKLKLPRRRTISSHASFSLCSPNPDTTSTPHRARPCPGPALLGSVTLPVYVYDCPLIPLTDTTFQWDSVHPPDLFEDRTFKWDCPSSKDTANFSTATTSEVSSEQRTEPRSGSPEPKPEEPDCPGLLQLSRALSLAYSKCFVLSLFESMHTGLWVHAVDVQAAVDECEEALVEVDITRFLQTVCGHLKDGFVDVPQAIVQTSSPRCQDLKLLHRLIKDKFRTLLGTAFRPVVSHPEFYYCVPAWDHKRLAAEESGTPQPGALANLTFHSDVVPLPLQGDSDTGPMVGVVGWDGVLCVTTPDDAHTSLLSNMDSNSLSELADEAQTVEEVSPLFLHLVCSVHAHGDMGSYSTRVLPTCINELSPAIMALEAPSGGLKVADNFQVTLDMLCLTLPRESESLSLSDLGERCAGPGATRGAGRVRGSPLLQQQVSGSSQGSARDSMDERLSTSVDQLAHLPDYQQRAVNNLLHEIKWLMRDEMAACALDEWPVRESTLAMVADHITQSAGRSTCLLETVPLQFVYETNKCLGKFLEALSDMSVNGYRVLQEGTFFYMVKDETTGRHSHPGLHAADNLVDASTPVMPELPRVGTESTIEQSTDGSTVILQSDNGHPFADGAPLGDQDRSINLLSLPGSASASGPADGDLCNWSETAARHSEVSSLLESALGTEDGYDGGSSDSGHDCAWLLELEQRRDKLPNFWLVLRVDGELVSVYFHCRFMDMETEEVSSYRAVFAGVLDQLRRLCRRVNQTLLLASLNDTQTCDVLLEPEQGEDGWPQDTFSFSRLKSLEDSREGDQAAGGAGAGSPRFEPGHFACGVVWDTHFVLHPRLKTGPGKGSLSRGIQALRSVLNRFSVTNRRNMFVYKDKQGNVFYLRLHENQRSLAKVSAPGVLAPYAGFGFGGGGGVRDVGRDGTDENSPCSVSRSSSTASLNTSRLGLGGGSRPHHADDGGSVSSISGDLRPRVRSFGEKDAAPVTPLSSSGEARWSAPVAREDFITLRVLGISEAGADVRQELMQVLQKRLDDAVLDVLSVMLGRNPMCKLSVEDVHFIQRSQHPPETSVQFSVPGHAEHHVQALAYYLHQELLPFLHQPRYTDPHPSGHFQDYSQSIDSPSYIPDCYMYLYNQTEASGSRGIACLAMGIMDRAGHLMLRSAPYRRPQLWAHAEAPLPYHFQDLTSVKCYWSDAQVGDVDTPLESTARVEFRIWKQGRVNLEALVGKLESAVRHAVWDLLTEFTILTAPIEEANTPAPTPVLTPNITPSTTPNSTTSALPPHTPNIVSRSQLHPVYHKSMQPWLEYAVELGVASVRKHNVELAFRHSLGVAVQELESLITSHAKDTRTVVFAEEVDGDNVTYRAWRWNDETCALPTRCLLLTRNQSQWRCYVADPSGPPSKADSKVANKGLQKFLPLIGSSPSDQRFVPRQRFLLTVVTSKDVAVLTYNWSKECVVSLTCQTTLLGHWLSARSSLLTSIICQKMGLFHNQPCQRNGDNKTNPYLARVGDLEVLTKFPRKENLAPTNAPGPPRRNSGWSGSMGSGSMGGGSGTTTPTAPHPQVPMPPPSASGVTLSALQNVFRDCRASPLSPGPGDLVVRHARQMLNTRLQDKHADQQRKLNTMWQSRGASPNIPLAADVLQLFLQHARTIHYCLTPLLFLPRWRLDSAATRDHSLSVSPPFVAAAPRPASRSGTGIGPSSSATRGASAKERRGSAASSVSPDRWHQALCAHFVHEYQQYLQTLGFIPVQTEASGTLKRRQNHYLQKSLLGGILMVELLLAEPFFHARLHALECSRMQTKSPAFISQFTVSFLDECDKVKVLLHLHSFAYDYHLRCLHGCVTARHSLLPPGYHLTLFLEDFLKYYPKAPNFARNLVHSDSVTVRDIATPSQQLFDYLLTNDKTYGMDVFRMAPVTYDENDTETAHIQNEFVLVQHKTTPFMSYRDVHDLKHTDDFDVTLIVTHDPTWTGSDDTVLCLKYFIVLTSRREMYPKPEIERKQGKFRTVSTATVTSVSTPPPPPPAHQNSAPQLATAQQNCVTVVVTPIGSAPTVSVTPLQEPPVVGPSSSSAPGLPASIPTVPAAVSTPALLEVVTQDVPAGSIATDRLPSPASEATPDLCSALVSLESPGEATSPPQTPGESGDSCGQLSTSHHVEIRQEAVNYLGYYSSHEQLMQQLILQQASAARSHIESMVTQGAVHCRTHMLWTRLMCPANSRQTGQGLSYYEFLELVCLARVEPLSAIDPRLAPVLTQPLAWYQGLARVLLAKYADLNRQFFASDGSAQHIVVLHPKYLDAFVMLSLDVPTARGELTVVYRTPPEPLHRQQDRRSSGARIT